MGGHRTTWCIGAGSQCQFVLGVAGVAYQCMMVADAAAILLLPGHNLDASRPHAGSVAVFNSCTCVIVIVVLQFRARPHLDGHMNACGF
jgi:hypothetical protein